MSIFRRSSKSKSKIKSERSSPDTDDASRASSLSTQSSPQQAAPLEKRRPRSWGGSDLAPRMNANSFKNSFTAAQDASFYIYDAVPNSFRTCIQYLSQPEVLKEDGLFRVSGQTIEVGKLSRIIDEHGYFDLRGYSDPNTVVGLLKHRMRCEEMPLKANEAKLFEMTICTAQELGMDAGMRASSTKDAVANLSPETSQTLLAIVKLLGKVHRAENLMTFTTLGTSVGIQVFPGVTAKRTGEIIDFLDCHSGSIWGKLGGFDSAPDVDKLANDLIRTF